MSYFHILAATDFSETGNSALARAVALAEEGNSKLTLLHVLPEAVASATGYPFVYPVMQYDPKNEEEVFTKVRAELARLAQSTSKKPIESTFVVRRGHPRDEILDVAAHVSADLIVVGTHGRQGAARIVLGSIAEQVARHAPVSVLVARSGEK